jgi:broad specificity phosphatase PhoE
MDILITRHGESESNVQGIISNRDLPHPLTLAGRVQSLALAKRLAHLVIKQIYASPILRAWETAGIIASKLGVPLVFTPALREFDCGQMEGRGDVEAWEAHREVTRTWDEDHDYERHIPPDGESFNNMKARFLPLLSDLLENGDRRPGSILLISHGGLLHQMLPLVFNNIDRKFTQQKPLGNCELVVAKVRVKRLVCAEWAGIKLL